MKDTSKLPPSIPADRAAVFNRISDALEFPGSQVLLTGETGIGKSFLLRAALRDKGFARQVLFSEATPSDQSRYRTVRDLLAGVPHEVLQKMSRPSRDAFDKATDGHLSDESTGLTTDFHKAIGHVLAHYAHRRSPIVIENWQWVDPDSRALLADVFRQPAVRGSLSLIVTARGSCAGWSQSTSTIFSIRDLVRVPLMQKTYLRNVVLREFSTQLAPDEEAKVVELSRGNPLWALELAALHSQNAPSGTVPTRIEDIIRERLAAVPPLDVELLQTVSALGRVRLADSTRYLPDGAAGLGAAVSAGVVVVEGEFIYPAYPLLSQTSLEILAPEERSHFFSRLANLPLSPAKRAELRDAATGAGVNEDLASELASAASATRQTGAVAPAARLAKRALLRTAADSRHLEERQLHAASYSLASGDIDSAVDDLVGFDIFALPESIFDQTVDILSEALYRKGGEALVRRRLGTFLERSGTTEQQRIIAQVYLISFARSRSASDLDRLRLLDSKLSAATAPRAKAAAKSALLEIQLDTGGGLNEEALNYLQQVDGWSLTATAERGAAAVEGYLAYQVDDLSRSRAALTTAVSSARTSGEKYALIQSVAHSSILETLSGRLSAAGQLLADVADDEGALTQHLPASIYRAKGLLALAYDDGELVCEIAEATFSPGGEHRGELLRKSLLGLLAAQRGDSEAAVELLSSAVHGAELRGITEPGRRMWIDVELIRSLIRLGAYDAVPDGIARLKTAAGNSRRLHALGQVDRLEALLLSAQGEHKNAITLIDRGVTRIMSSGFRLEAVRTLLDQTRILDAAGHPLRGPETLQHAQQINSRVQSVSLGREISRAQSERRQSRGTEILTASERRVADLIAEGLSNRAAATALHLSQRTVETHLSNIYRKTGTHSRTQLVLLLGN